MNPQPDPKPLPVVSLEERQRISDNLRSIFERTAQANPVYPFCMVSPLDFLDQGELGLAIDFFFQSMCNPNDWLVDISLHDLLYVLHASRHLGVSSLKIKDFQFLEDYVVQLYD